MAARETQPVSTAEITAAAHCSEEETAKRRQEETEKLPETSSKPAAPSNGTSLATSPVLAPCKDWQDVRKAPSDSNASPSQSSSSSSSEQSESSSDKGSEREGKPPAEHLSRLQNIQDSIAAATVVEDGEESCPVYSRNEIVQDKIAVAAVDVRLSPTQNVVPFGSIKSIMDKAIVLQSVPGALAPAPSPLNPYAPPEDALLSARAFDADTVVCLVESRKVVGRIFETLGPVVSPFYLVRFNSREEIRALGDDVKVGASVGYVPEFSTVICARDYRTKGYDASNLHDEELCGDRVEFSDDEAEASAKKVKKRGGGGGAGDTAGLTVFEQQRIRPGASHPAKRSSFQRHGRAPLHANSRGGASWHSSPHPQGCPGSRPAAMQRYANYGGQPIGPPIPPPWPYHGVVQPHHGTGGVLPGWGPPATPSVMDPVGPMVPMAHLPLMGVQPSHGRHSGQSSQPGVRGPANGTGIGTDGGIQGRRAAPEPLAMSAQFGHGSAPLPGSLPAGMGMGYFQQMAGYGVPQTVAGPQQMAFLGDRTLDGCAETPGMEGVPPQLHGLPASALRQPNANIVNLRYSDQAFVGPEHVPPRSHVLPQRFGIPQPPGFNGSNDFSR